MHRRSSSHCAMLPCRSVTLVALFFIMCTLTHNGGIGIGVVEAATAATRIIADGVPVEIVFVSDPDEMLTTPDDLDTDDYNRPIPSMGGAVCSSLSGPNCLSMLYDTTEMDLFQESLDALGLGDLDLGDFGLGGDFEFVIDGGIDDDGLGGYFSNEELLSAGMVEFFYGYSKIYARRTTHRTLFSIPEELATDMESYADEVGLDEDFVPQFELFWSNLENDDYEYQAFVVDAQGLSGSEVAEQLSTYLDGSRHPDDVSFNLYTFLIDFDGIKPLDDLDSYPSHIQRRYVPQERFLKELLESLIADPGPDRSEYLEDDIDVLESGDGDDVYYDDEDDGDDDEDDDDTLSSSYSEHENQATTGSTSDSSSSRRRGRTDDDQSDARRSRTDTASSSSSSSSSSSKRDGSPIQPREG